MMTGVWSGNLASVLEQRCWQHGWSHRTAYIADGQLVDHGTIHSNAARIAGALMDLGICEDQPIVVLLPDGAEFVTVFLAVVRSGAVAVPVNPELPADELRRLLDVIRPRLVVAADEHGSPLGWPTVQVSLLVQRSVGRAEAAAIWRSATCAAYAQFSSGTTGTPKAIVHGHSHPVTYAAAFGDPVLGLNPADTVLSVSRMFFAYGLGNSLFYPLYFGCRAILHRDRPTPSGVCADVTRYGVSVVFSVPSFYARLLAAGHGPSLSKLRLAVTAGERLPLAVNDAFADASPAPLLDGLGSTEIGQAFTSNRLAGMRRGTVGRVLPPYEVRVVGEDGRPKDPGEIGLLQVKGPTLPLMVLNDPFALDAMLDGDWLRTTDLASIDQDGYIALHGRQDDIENVAGVKIDPAPVEEALLRKAGVLEAAVVARRDHRGVAKLAAFVVTASRSDQCEPFAQDLAQIAREALPFYLPAVAITFVEALPRTPTGKLQRFVLREAAA